MSATNSPRDHWPLHARQWALVGPPLRPCGEDVGIVAGEVAAWAAGAGRAPRALLLGVTPELAGMEWPEGTTLVAVDRSQAMIEAIFPASGTPAGARAVVGEWLALAEPSASFDVAVGDGSLSNLAFPAGYRAFAAELARVLAGDGRLVLRLFAAPERRERIEEVAAALHAGRVKGFHALKWRIAMAVQPEERNVRVVEIRRAFDEIAPDRAELAARTGWAMEVIATIDAYRDSDLVYSFPTLAEVREALGEQWVVRAVHTPGYELGERCPTVVLARR